MKNDFKITLTDEQRQDNIINLIKELMKTKDMDVVMDIKNKVDEYLKGEDAL